MRRLLLLIALVTLALPVSALGATRFATPGAGASPACPRENPCSLAVAIEAASAGDEVVVTRGAYDVGTEIEVKVPLSIQGEPGQPQPRIVGAMGITPIVSFQRLRLAHLTLESSESAKGTLFAVGPETVLDRLELIARGEGALALRPGFDFTLTNSVLFATGKNASGLFLQGTNTGTARMRNDTVVALGAESIGIGMFVTKIGATVTVEATNVIADGTLDAQAGATAGATASIVFDHSNLDTSEGAVTMKAGQTTPPIFVDAPGGNLQQAPGSPTIDAGLNDPANGLTDLFGSPRTLPRLFTCGSPLPAITDIGAFEHVPATPSCIPPAAVPLETRIVRARIRGRRARFRFTGSGGTPGLGIGFSCKLDRRPWRACASPKTYKRLKAGRHVFRVRATGGGAVDATAAKRRFRVKRTSKRTRSGMPRR
jgi:hypothetical protein